MKRYDAVLFETSRAGSFVWVSKFDNCKILGRALFQGRLQYTKAKTIIMYLPIEIGHYVHKQCNGEYIEMKKLETDILRNFSHKDLGVLKGDFSGFGCLKDAQPPCWLRLCSRVLQPTQACSSPQKNMASLVFFFRNKY